MDKARVVQRLDVVAEADELRVRGRLELAEREVHALAERIDEANGEGAEHGTHEQRGPPPDRAADERAVDGCCVVFTLQFDHSHRDRLAEHGAGLLRPLPW